MATYSSASEYITHHLTHFVQPISGGEGFWTFHADTMLTTVFIGVVVYGFLWLVARKPTEGVPSKTQAFIELSFDFIERQVKDVYNGPNKLLAPLALTTFVLTLFMNAMDFLPVDITSNGLGAIGMHTFRFVPTADVNTTFALALFVWGMMVFYHIKTKGLGGWLHELAATPFGLRPAWASPLLLAFNVLFNIVEYISKPLSHSLRLYGNMYAGEIIFLLIALLAAATGIVGTFFGIFLNLAWAIFHILIVVLQAYIFMMLAVVYVAMGHEHH